MPFSPIYEIKSYPIGVIWGVSPVILELVSELEHKKVCTILIKSIQEVKNNGIS